MHRLFTHASVLVGLLVFLKQAWSYAPLGRSILIASSTGLAIYLLLLIGSVLVQRIIAYTPPESNPQKRTSANERQSMSESASESATEETASSSPEPNGAADTASDSSTEYESAPREPVASPMA